MNATDLLKQDHDRAKKLFKDFQETNQRSQLAQNLCKELEVHLRIEEEIFYPAAQQKGGELQGLIQHGIEEHRQAASMIDQLKGVSDESQLETMMQQLQQAVEQHVSEEEGQVFPLANREMGDELSEVGRQMQERKQSLLASA